MQNFKPGTLVPISFSLLDESGEVLKPTAIRWRVLDETEQMIADWVDMGAMPTTSEITLPIPSSTTTLAPGVLRGIRTVEMEVTTALGTVTLTEQLMLQGPTALAFGINSFQTFSQAILLAEDFTPDQMQGWLAVERETREKALIQAYQRILLLPLNTNMVDGWNQSMLTTDTVVASLNGRLKFLSPEQMLNLAPTLLTALRSAQLVEAFDILAYDPVAEARRAGLNAVTVGESSQFFRPIKPLELPICTKAMAYLQQWVRFGAVIGRS